MSSGFYSETIVMRFPLEAERSEVFAADGSWCPAVDAKAISWIHKIATDRSFIIGGAVIVMSVVALYLSLTKIITVFPLLFLNTFIVGLGMASTTAVKHFSERKDEEIPPSLT